MIHHVKVGSTRGVTLSFDNTLESGETVSAVSSVTSSPVGMTIAGEAVTTGSVEVNGKTVATGRAITFTVSGGSDGEEFRAVATVTTSGSQTIVDDETVIVWEATG